MQHSRIQVGRIQDLKLQYADQKQLAQMNYTLQKKKNNKK